MRSEESFLTILYNHCTIKNILKINNEPMLIAFVHLISQHTDWFREVYQNASIQFTYGDSFAAGQYKTAHFTFVRLQEFRFIHMITILVTSEY